MYRYTREDVQFHSDGFRDSNPAVNVKVYGSMRDAFPAFVREEAPDPRFTLEWVEENLTDEDVDSYFWSACESEYEYLEAWATSGEDCLFPGERVTLQREGRSGGWIAVLGLPELEDWDAVRLARWRKFERIAREIAAGIPLQMLSSIYLNAFDVWADEQDDRAAYNDAAPVDQALACR